MAVTWDCPENVGKFSSLSYVRGTLRVEPFGGRFWSSPLGVGANSRERGRGCIYACGSREPTREKEGTTRCRMVTQNTKQLVGIRLSENENEPTIV